MRAWSTSAREPDPDTLAREYWFELLVGALAVAGMRRTCDRTRLAGLADDDACGSPYPQWRSSMLPLFARRCFPFAAPAAYWILAAALSFVDGRADPVRREPRSSSGWRPPSCSGTCATPGRRGSAWRSCSSASRAVVYNIPGRSDRGPRLHSPRFGVAWAAGYALRSGPSRPKRRSYARPRPSASARRPHASRWQRSVRGSRGSSTTSSLTP